MLLVDRERLPCEEVHGNRVARKRIQYEDVKFLEVASLRLPFEGEPRIAQHDLDPAR